MIQVGNHVEPKGFANPQCGRVYSTLGVSPTVNTCGGETDNRRYSNAPAVAEVTAADGCSGSKWETVRRRTH